MKHLAIVIPLCAAVLGGCVAPGAELPVVPPPFAERVPAPPRSQVPLIWRPGHHDWTGSGYVWIPGQWEDRGDHGTLWQDGYWERRGLEYVWVAPHWL